MGHCFIRTLLIALSLHAFGSGASAADARKNVILICADDLNTNLGCYGHPQVRSPNIDRLAARGVRFERAYCQYPVCNASRTSFLSGRRPATTGVIDNATPPRTFLGDAAFLPQHFKQHGYRAIKVGKIFHTGPKFEDAASWDVDIRETSLSKTPPPEQVVGRRAKHGVILNCDDAETWDGQVARRGVEQMEEAVRSGKPFFLAVGFRRPHTPYIAPQKYHEMYPNSAIVPLIEPADHLTKIPQPALTYKIRFGERMTEEARPDIVGSYFASITFMDAQVGVLLDAIDHAKLWEKTVVLFLSDHGYHLGEHGGLWHKMTVFEAAAHVPLIIAAPGQQPGKRNQLVELIDLYPTLCAMCGVAPPTGLEGTSLIPVLENSDEAGKQAAYTVVARRGQGVNGKLDPNSLGRSVRTPRWRYTEWFDGSRELYDYQNDPHEYRNLADDPAHTGSVAELARLLVKLGPQTGAVQ